MCEWGGSGLGFVEPVVIGSNVEYAFARMNDAGQPIGNLKYLNIHYADDAMPGPLGWESPSYYAFYKNSMIVITP